MVDLVSLTQNLLHPRERVLKVLVLNANEQPDQLYQSLQMAEQNVEVQNDSSITNSNQNPNIDPVSGSDMKTHDPTYPSSPYFIGSNDSTGAVLVTHMLETNNYHSWARSMKRALRIKNKLGFIDGTLCEPSDQNDPLMEHWLRCNYLASEHHDNRYQMQHYDNVSVYFSKFKTLLDELLNYKSIPNCTCGGLKVVVQNQQRDWVMKFLMGLNESYKDLKAQILLMKPFPTLNEVYATIQQEEKRGNLRESRKQNSSLHKKDNYYRTHCRIAGQSLERCFKANPNRPICSHCQMHGHKANKCFKLHGYPFGYKDKEKSKYKAAANQASALMPLNQEHENKTQVSLTQELYSQLMACSNHQQTKSKTLIQLQTLFQSSLVTCSMALPNGNTIPATEIGTAQVTKSLVLRDVLCVPSFSFNLISVRKLTQDPLTWKTTGMGELKFGLYHMLQTTVSPTALQQSLTHLAASPPISATVINPSKDFDIWHYG
ncbi:uncharacterized protein LOC111375346 [Olea europaea var. sylvestris]|uniref:uncharacterized protein LOC111375346 n=1 Tax=Olea europaea var. sylvestris TaxID=158386 RepID=UPI000C1CFE33|nr:uncharacterized protein LOC111375346 [Olea europaea var. sylvestris]